MLFDQLLPDWAIEVESGFACLWYASFALIDLIALCFAEKRLIRFVLAVSCAWSVTLAVETIMLEDVLQSNDWIAQWLIDGILSVFALRLFYVRYLRGRK